MLREPLSRDEVISAIERTGCGKIPLVFHKWWGNGLREKYGNALDRIAEPYPDDIFAVFYRSPGEDISPTPNPHYRWGYREDYSTAERHSIGELKLLLPDWSELDRFLADFPDPNEPGIFDHVKAELLKAGSRYKLGCWWCLFHERFWYIRGMENIMYDYYDNMDELKLLGRRLLDFYKIIVDRFAQLGFDGIFTSDDLGHQNGPMMSPQIFKELYFPLYEEFISYVHSKGMHVFLHSCGDNTLLMDDLVRVGLDVFHPVQTGCMDTRATAERFGGKISFLAGVDVQNLIPNGTPDAVRQGIKKLITQMHKPEGGLLLAAGNGILADSPLENINAMLETMTLGAGC